MTKHKTIQRKSWTKKDIAAVLDLWETKTKAEIAEQLDVKMWQLTYLIKEIEKAGYKIPKKKQHHQTQILIKEVLKARKLIK